MTSKLTPGMIVSIMAFDDVPEHRFRISTIEDDHVTGFAISGPLEGTYGEPARSLITQIGGRYDSVPD